MSIRPSINKELEVVKQFELAVRSLLEYFSGTGENYRMALDYIDQYTSFARIDSSSQAFGKRQETTSQSIHQGNAGKTRNNSKTTSSNPTGSPINHYRFNGIDYPIDWDNVESDSYKEFGR